MQRVDGGEVFLLVALPCEDAVVLCVEDETPEVSHLEVRLRLYVEAAAHVVVAVNHVEIVALGASEKYARDEQPLL